MRKNVQIVDSFSCHKTTLGALLRAEENYVVPLFQRYYAWDTGNFSDFWQDISQTFLEDSSEYLLGSVVFNVEEAPQLFIIDGQQRLTTASILLCALRNHLIECGKNDLANELEEHFLVNMQGTGHFTPKLILNGYDKDFYHNYIFQKYTPFDAKTLAQKSGLPTSNKYLASCYDYMHNKIKDMCEQDWQIENLTSSILAAYDKKLVIININVGNDQDAFRLFETLNERGRDLSKFDLLKNHMFSIANEKLRSVQTNWEIISQHLGYQRTVKFIRHHWMSTKGEVREKDLFIKIQSYIITSDMAEEYTASLVEPSALYGAFFSYDHHLWDKYAKGKRYHLRHLLHATKVMQAEQLFIVLLAILESNPKMCVDMLRMLTIFTFRYSTICGMPAASLTSVYINAAHHIRKNPNTTADEVFSKFFADLYPDDQQFHEAFSNKFTRDKALARYILIEINNSLDGRPSMETQTNTSVTDLEHIVPIKYDEYWKDVDQKSLEGIEQYVHYLGNMTLLSSKLNQGIGNSDFETKKEAYIKDSIAITEWVVAMQKWGIDEIMERQKLMADEAVKIWRYDSSS